MLNTSLLRQITNDNIVKDFYDRVRIRLPYNIQKHYEYLLVNDDGTIDEHCFIEEVFVDVVPERNAPFYFFCFGCNVDVDISADFDCDYINNLIKTTLSCEGIM